MSSPYASTSTAPPRPPTPTYTYVFFDVEIGGEAAGRIIIRLFSKDLPITCRNFMELARGVHGFGYKGTKFHRCIPNFMIQGGDFTTGDGTGGRSIYGPRFRDENFKYKHTKKGLVAMANTGPNSNASQFYICCQKTSHLDNRNVVFAEIAEGMDVVHKIEQCGSAPGDVTPDCVIVDCGAIDWTPQKR
ncbi:hypothetical protein CALCODRAFT_446375 [Calocera cornea HHB12733]|uniref:Peptidyl-prolyl cis-trans isomerase n=1 Tax=Calocera cornea HHB12733 TaxID=1353952 RepID=A0A165JQM4_9BASI|nr:hypothetical protein CALCODRAFT_446375 [Calocera cornea HHB12733]